jgi:hypothetical protein
MKILESFDTRLDAEELLEAVDKYGEWNVILIKRHRIKLVWPLLLIFVSIILLGILLYVIYSHLFDEHKVIFRILAIFYIYTTFSWSFYAIYWLMRNIIWQIKAKKKYIDTVRIAKRKQVKFEKFLKRTFLTFGAHVLVFLFNATVPFIVIKSTWIWSIAVTVWALILDFIFILIVNRVMYRIMEYEMNFDICTKDSFTAYSQKWFFKTKTTNITTPAIKVIQDSKEWLVWALLQYWNLSIHTDGDLDAKWWKILELYYIPDPKRLAKKLNSIIEENRWTLS